MELCFIKESALDTLKASLPQTVDKYFTQQDNAWLVDVCDENPFVKFRDVPDFELAPLDEDLGAGEIEFRNCKILYKNLHFLTPRQAADERFWAGLCHGVFYDYVRRRWKFDTDEMPLGSNTVKSIQSRFFFGKGSSRENIFTNTLSKYWWTGRAFFDARQNNFEKLDIIGATNFYTKIFSIMTRSCAANPKILGGIIKFIKHMNDENIKLTTEKHLRPALSELNKRGGAVVLDCLTEEEIAAIMIEHVKKNFKPETVTIDVQTGNISKTVSSGKKITVVSLDNDNSRRYKFDDKLRRKFPDIFNEFVGKMTGSVVTIRDEKFKITEIN